MRLLKLLSLTLGMLLFGLSSILAISRLQPSPAWLGFSDYYHQMYLYDLHHKELHSIGNGAYPIWSPKGDWIMYGTTTYSNFPSELHVARYPYRASKLITSPNFPYSQESPRISPDGKWVAFIAWAGMEAYGMFYMSADGQEIYHLSNWYGAGTAWSSDGKTLAFVYEGGLYTVDVGHAVPIDIANPPPFGAISLPIEAKELVNIPDMKVGSPQWSVDGEWLYFVLEGHLHRVKQDGSQLEQLTDDQREGWVIIFDLSPDGKQIAFIDYNDFYVMRSDGSQLKRLTVKDLMATPIGWSPDGRWIYFQNSFYEDSIARGVYRMRSDGNQVEQLTEDGIFSNVVLSPDGEWIAYFSIEEFALYRMRSDGSSKELLVKTHPEVTFISWSPPINKSWDYFSLLGTSIVLIGGGLVLQRVIIKRGI